MGKYYVNNKNLALYLKDINKYNPMTKEVELSCFENYYSTKDNKYRDLIINSSLRYVVKLAIDLCTNEEDFNDLISEGNYGLVTAFDKYDYKSNNRFYTYASKWAFKYMMDYYYTNSNVVMPPKNFFISKQLYSRNLSELEKQSEKDDYNNTIDPYLLNLFNNNYSTILESSLISTNEDITDKLEHFLVKEGINIEYDVLNIDNYILYVASELKRNVSTLEYMVFAHLHGVFGFQKLSINDISDIFYINKYEINNIKEKCIKFISITN